MNQLTFLNIYENNINDARDTAETLVEEAVRLLDDLDEHVVSAQLWRVDLDAAVLERLKETIDVEDLTNSIIDAYFSVAVDAVMQNPFFEKHGLSFSWFANYDCSDIEVHLRKGDIETCETYYDGTLTDMVEEALISESLPELSSLVEQYLQGINREYPEEWLRTDMCEADDFASFYEEIREMIASKELSESYKEIIDMEAREIEKEME